ncbi:MAG: substrate-binding domain-containing protein [Anaerolineae bacterium]|nr:substrate-binding domain-containing protein [Anaerolineae bacterium]
MGIGITANRTVPTLGLFISRLGRYGNYQEAIWRGVAQAAEEYQADVLCFVGGDLESQIGFQKHWNVTYDLAGPDNLDGLIVSAALQNYITIEAMARFCARYAPLPMVSIAIEIDGIPSITVDNYVGMRDLMRHLIDDHHYRRIAFVRGPEHNLEANTRYRAYKETIEAYGIPFDPALVAPGDFSPNAGSEAVSLWIDQRKINFEVVVASNDATAIGVWQELTRRGFDIPSDIGITGFDDVPDAGVFVTPLTTIRQPLIEQGYQAARMLLAYCRDGVPPKSLVLNTELVTRESCGCLSWAISDHPPVAPLGPGNILEGNPDQRRDSILADIQKVLHPHFTHIPSSAIEEFVDVFFDTLQGNTPSNFLPVFSRLLRTGTRNLSRAELDEGVISRWQEVLSILSTWALSCDRPEVRAHIDALLYQGRISITGVAERAHSNLRMQAEASILIQSEAIRDINAASDIQQIAGVLARYLPKLGIRTFALALYEGKPIPPPFSRLILACQDGNRLDLGTGGLPFPSKQLIPAHVFPDNHPPFLIIHPLVIRDLQFGFVLMEVLVGYRTMLNTYERFSEQIGAALHKVLLLHELNCSNEDLEQGTIDLEEANTRLEQFAYVASHDLQEPLRMVASYLQLLEKRYQDKLDDDAQEFIGHAVDGAIQMKQMIGHLLSYARAATRAQTIEPVDCEHLFAYTLSNLATAVSDSHAQITHDPLPIVMADGTQLQGVFQNLISNAIKFHADDPPQVHISAERQGDRWIFSVRDNGIGIAPEDIEHIFLVFNRLHTQVEYPGAGIGLAICKKVIERHEGRIWVESQPGKGTTMFFSIPACSIDFIGNS